MSRENVEIVDRYFGQLSRNLVAHRDAPHSYASELQRGESDPATRAVLDLLHPDVVWINQLGERYVGKLGCAHWADELIAASEFYSFAHRETEDLGADQVLSEHDVVMQGSSSGAEARTVVFTVFTVHDGLIVRMVEYRSRDEALESAGSQ